MIRRAAVLVATALAVGVGETRAQSRTAVTVVPYVGAFRLDDSELDPFGIEIDSGLLLGIRAEHPLGSRWAVGGSYGFGPFSVGATGTPISIDGAAHLYYGTVAWTAWRGSPEVRLTAGLGGVTLTSELDTSFTNLLLGFGGDLALPLADRFRVRVGVRDFLHFCAGSEPGEISGCRDDTLLNHVEVSTGLAVDF